MRFSHQQLAQSIRDAAPAVVPYLTGGYPNLEDFVSHLDALSTDSPAIEVGIPFSDPMADGATIQESSRIALERGATLTRILEALAGRANREAPVVVMSYLNPLLASGLTSVIPALADVGVAALVIPDLPFEESGPLAEVAGETGIGLVQLVTPVTDLERLQLLAGKSQGFTYAVTMTGTTGGEMTLDEKTGAYLDLVKHHSAAPVVAGFGVRSPAQVKELAQHCDGVIVGSALVETIGRGDSPVEFIRELAS